MITSSIMYFVNKGGNKDNIEAKMRVIVAMSPFRQLGEINGKSFLKCIVLKDVSSYH